MKRTLNIILSLTVSLIFTGCDPAPTVNQTPPGNNAPATDSSAAPTNPVATATPAAVATTPAAADVFSVTSAIATKQTDSSYSFIISGTAFGTFTDYHLLQVIVGSKSIILVNGGVVQNNPSAVTTSSISGTAITFNVKAISPSASDKVQLSFEKTPGQRISSNQIDLTLN